MVCLSFLHYTSLCISCDKNLGEFLMLCFVLWALCCTFLSIKIYVCTWVDLLFVNTWNNEFQLVAMEADTIASLFTITHDIPEDMDIDEPCTNPTEITSVIVECCINEKARYLYNY